MAVALVAVALAASAPGGWRWQPNGSGRAWLAAVGALALLGVALSGARAALDSPLDPHTGHWGAAVECAPVGCWARAHAASQQPLQGLDEGALEDLSAQDLIDEVLRSGVKSGYSFEVEGPGLAPVASGSEGR